MDGNWTALNGKVTGTSVAIVQPIINVPMGDAFGLPLGMSFYGTAFSEPTLVKLASGFEVAKKAAQALVPADVALGESRIHGPGRKGRSLPIGSHDDRSAIGGPRTVGWYSDLAYHGSHRIPATTDPLGPGTTVTDDVARTPGSPPSRGRTGSAVSSYNTP